MIRDYSHAVYEMYTQLRGKAEDGQIKDPRIWSDTQPGRWTMIPSKRVKSIVHQGDLGYAGTNSREH
jgi:hypothetical protein